MIVDFGIPEQGLVVRISVRSMKMNGLNDLVSIAPEKGFGADVLIGVFDTFLQGWHVLPMLPMLIPKVLRIQRGKNYGWDNDAVLCELRYRFVIGTRAVY